MPRPLRDQVPGYFHVTGRGTGPSTIFRCDADRESFDCFLGLVLGKFRWDCDSICLMGTHYHLLVETREENLAAGMQRLNGLFAQAFNQRHRRVGHLFQGRYGSEPVRTEAHLLEVIRYIALNPVLAGLCATPAEWEWSSYARLVGAPCRLRVRAGERVLELFGGDRATATARLRRFVEDAPLWTRPAA
jgi:REP element-mobilizing transposase RayT